MSYPQSPSQLPYGPPPQPPKKRHRVRNTLLAIAGVFVLLMIVGAIAGSGGNSSQPGAQPAANTSPPSAASSSAQAASSPCTSHHCISEDAEQGLPGGVAKDNSVATKVSCYESTVKPDGNDDYTVDCAVTYSDNSTADGYATVELAKNEVLFEPSGYDG
jgi:hypothetical protein